MATPSMKPVPTAPAPKTHGAADWLLARLPWFRDRYESWSKTKRTVIAILLYIVLLPVIPIIVAIVMYIRDPEGFKKSKAFPILAAIIVAQLGAFGVIANQKPKVTAPAQDSSAAATAADQQAQQQLEQSDKAAKERKKQNPEAVSESQPTGGKYFANCTAAFEAGVHDIPRSDKSYREPLDGDKDGVACEK